MTDVHTKRYRLSIQSILLGSRALRTPSICSDYLVVLATERITGNAALHNYIVGPSRIASLALIRLL